MLTKRAGRIRNEFIKSAEPLWSGAYSKAAPGTKRFADAATESFTRGPMKQWGAKYPGFMENIAPSLSRKNVGDFASWAHGTPGSLQSKGVRKGFRALSQGARRAGSFTGWKYMRQLPKAGWKGTAALLGIPAAAAHLGNKFLLR